MYRVVFAVHNQGNSIFINQLLISKQWLISDSNPLKSTDSKILSAVSSQFDAPRQRNMSSAYQVHLPYAGDLESPELFDVSKVSCKKSLVHLGHRIDPGHQSAAFVRRKARLLEGLWPQ